MKQWEKQEIEIALGAKVMAQDAAYKCYANTNNAAALENWKRHCQCPYAETITGK